MNNKDINSRQRQKMRKQQGGFTLVEIAVVLALLGGLIATAITIGKGWSSAGDAKAVVDNSVNSVRKIQTGYSTYTAAVRYSGLNLAGIEPDLTQEFKQAINSAETQIVLDWGSYITVAPSSVTGATGNSNMLWTYTNLPREQCKTIIQGIAPASVYILQGATGTTVLLNDATGDVLLPADANAACSADAATNTFRVVY